MTSRTPSGAQALSRLARLRDRMGRRRADAEPPNPRVLRRGDGRASAVLHDIATRLRDTAIFAGGEPERTSLSHGDLDDLREAIAIAVRGRGGEPLARARAADLGRTYLVLDADGRATFLEILATDHGIDSDLLLDAVNRYRDDALDQRPADIEPIRRALIAPSTLLLQRFSVLDDGVRFLLLMREDALNALPDRPAIRPLERDLRETLATWFDVGFLELKRVTWDSPASLLERLAEYEAVHSVRDWDDLKHRLDIDRRVYGFFHPRMPLEPLIFVEVALVDVLPEAIGPLLDETIAALDPDAATTATFYSITNAQRGLDGISLGGLLIKQVVDELHRDFPRIRTFATLSPVPGFHRWLARWEGELVTEADRELLDAAWPNWTRAAIIDGAWAGDDAATKAVAAPLVRACAQYLLTERRDDEGARDRVAHFHLSNGARIERINWLGDPSARGMRQSLGIMVNYLYNLPEIEENHDAYTRAGAIAASGAVADLLED